MPSGTTTDTARYTMNGPYPPDFRTTTSPSVATTIRARPKVLQGVVRPQGFVSLPVVETKTRAGAGAAAGKQAENSEVLR